MVKTDHEEQYMEYRRSYASKVFEPRDGVLARGFTAKNYSIQRHDHDFFEVNIVLSGEGVHIINDTPIHTKAGDVFVIPPGFVHGWSSEGAGFNVYHVILKERFFERYSQEISTFSGFKLLFEVEPKIRCRSNRAYLSLNSSSMDFLLGTLKLFESLKDESTPESDTLRSALALTVIGYLSGKASDRRDSLDSESGESFDAICSTLEYIHNNLSAKLTVDFLAEYAKMSRATFIRKFKALCSVSVHDYIAKLRLDEAKRLLNYGKSMTEVANECGYYDASHLYRIVKHSES